jgi:hypothetical protein
MKRLTICLLTGLIILGVVAGAEAEAERSVDSSRIANLDHIPLVNQVPLADLSAPTGTLSYYSIETPPGAYGVVISISGGTGDADLYVKFGAQPSLASYDCRPYKLGNTEGCSFWPPEAGTYHIMLHAFEGYEFLILEANYTFQPPPPLPPEWQQAGSAQIPRANHSATLLPSGKILVAGGLNFSPLASAEIYDPATGEWKRTGDLQATRHSHTATLLPSGKVLVVGGYSDLTCLSSAEVFDPATNAWAAVSEMSGARHGHTATLLSSGKVMIVGGGNGQIFLDSRRRTCCGRRLKFHRKL